MSGHESRASRRPRHGGPRAAPPLLLRRAALAGVCLLSAACGSGEPTRPYLKPSTENPRPGSTFDAGATGAPPTIEIRSPAADALWPVTSAPEVRARITAPNAILEPSSIRFQLRRDGIAASTPDDATGALSGPLLDAEFTGRLNLAGLAGGSYTLTVHAATTTGASATASLGLRVDAGPAVTIVAPAAGSHHKGSLVISVVVDSAPFEPTMTVEASVAGRPVTLTAGGSEKSVQGSVDFRGYDPPLRGEQLLSVVATNANGTRTTTTARFVVDEDGPVIVSTTPGPSDVVGRVIELRAHITDDAGVVDSSVVALIGDQATPMFRLNLIPRGSGIYSVPFDTALLTRCGLLNGGLPTPGTFCMVYPTVSFRAADALGNETTLSYSFGIDNQPPLLDLNPPEIRVSRRKNAVQCSWAFDPLGDHRISGNMPDDGCAVSQVFQMRARAQDDVNGARGLQVAPLATIDAARIDVYVLNDTTQPLTVDSDGDGVCDLINPKLQPTTSPPTSSREVLKMRLSPVPPNGAADFTPDPSLAATGETRCEPGDDLDLPRVLCRASEPTIAISYGPRLPAVWSLDPIEPDGLRCFGNQFDAYANHIGGSSSRGAGSPPPGWACIAVQATDKVGNTGVSAPLRVWIDYDGRQVCPAVGNGATTPPPDCTGRFNAQTGTVDGTACTSRRYTSPAEGPELCLDGNC